tara:strand:+ start:9057 stop:9233 length:177 start_codon:yes stop_codon:yes gene_type:complete
MNTLKMSRNVEVEDDDLQKEDWGGDEAEDGRDDRGERCAGDEIAAGLDRSEVSRPRRW